MKKYLVFFLVFTFLFPSFCNAQSQTNQIDTEFFIPIEKTNLYTRVVGNPEKPIIITLHGGPGAFNVDHEFYRNVFEKDYLMVYFDHVPKKDKELVYIKNASHNIPTEEPEQLYEALTSFFKKHN